MRKLHLIRPALVFLVAALLVTDSALATFGTTERVSVDSAGNQANLYSDFPAISDDGRLVAFESDASNLAPGDTNTAMDIFVHDRQTGATTRVSVDSAGNQANGISFFPAISGDGRFVAFVSQASNLVPGDTNGGWDSFVHDRQTGATTRVNVDSAGNQAIGALFTFSGPAISDDGRFVAFESFATNLVSGDTSPLPDIFVRDRQTGSTTRVSVDSAGAQALGNSFFPAISGDGRFVAFMSDAFNLVPGDTNNVPDIFVHDRQTGATTRVSVDSTGNQMIGHSLYPAISGDGRLVAFVVQTFNPTRGISIFVHDRQTGATTRVNVDSAGTQANAANYANRGPALSADGRFVAFQSFASNLVPGDTNSAMDIFVHDRGTAQNAAPMVDAGADAVIAEGSAFAASGSFSDPNADTWIVTVDYGDGSGSQPLTLTGQTFTLSHAYADDGMYTVTVTVRDNQGGEGRDTVTVTVNNVAPTVMIDSAGLPASSPEGTAINLAAMVSDPGAADTFTYAWSVTKDGAPFASSTNAAFSFTPDDEGSYAVTLTVSDYNGGASSAFATISVINAPPTISAAVNSGPIDEGASATVTVSATDPAGANDPLSYAFDCDGDGIYEIGPQAGNAATCSFGDNGSFQVNVRVTDDSGSAASAATTVVVTNVAPSVNPPSLAPQPANEGNPVAASATFSDPGPNDGPFTCTVNYGDGTGDHIGMVSGSTCSGPAHAYADNGVYNVTVTVTDDGGAAGSATASVTVNNVAPTVGQINAPINPVAIGTPITVNASVTDPGTGDTHTAVWGWGDGTTSAGTVSAGSVGGSHTYAAAGIYTIGLSVTDDEGGIGSAVFQYVVVYDPSGGYVTGGGWIDSPAGAYPADPSLEGRATFGFVSRYQRGATVPTGVTQFRFQVADLHFRSNSYEWLVVAGARAQYKGAGTTNGAGDYGFMLTAIDGQINGGGGSDKFRIKIWDKATGTVVYDNQIGAADDATPTTIIGGGSIAIQSGE